MKGVHPVGLTLSATSWLRSLAFFLCFVYDLTIEPDVKNPVGQKPTFFIAFFWYRQVKLVV